MPIIERGIPESGESTYSDSSFEPRTKSSQIDLKGVWAPCLTPVLPDYSIDHERLRQHVNWLLSSGCHGIVLFGTTGEAASFSAVERMQALESLLESGVSPSEIILGNGFPSITDSIEVSRHAVSLGCRAVLMVPPFYFKNLSTVGLAASYQYVLDKVDCPDLRVLLYHFPRMSTVPISYPLVDALIKSHGAMIAGLKDSSGEWESVIGFIRHYPDISVFPGTDTFLLEGLNSGGAGTITATADINPNGIRHVYDLWRRGDDAEDAQSKANVIRMIISRYPLAAALKAVHAHLRSDPGWNRLRPPLEPLSTSEQTELMESLSEAGFALADFDDSPTDN